MASLRKNEGRYSARFYEGDRFPKQKEVALGTSRKSIAGEEEEVSNATKRHRHSHLATFFRWAIEKGWADENPMEKVSKPRKEEKKKAFFEPEDVEKVLNAIDAYRKMRKGEPGPTPSDQWLKEIIVVAFRTGLRRGELLNLQWRDVDLDEGFVMVRNRDDFFKAKSGHECTVPLRGDGLERLRQMHEARTDTFDGAVFADRNGNPIKPDRVSKRFKFFVRKAKLKNEDRLHFHSLRHTTGSWLAIRGVPLPVISKILGHSSMDVTEVYSHVSLDVTVQVMENVFGST